MQPGIIQSKLYNQRVSFGSHEEWRDEPTPLTNRMRDLQEYLLVIKPGHDIFNKVASEEEDFYNRYPVNRQEKETPYISLAGFWAKESMEATLIRWIGRICSRQKSFMITLNNYCGIPPHTIYLRVQDHEPFRQFAQQLKIIDEYVQANGCPEVRFITRPHLSIAKHLPEMIYDQAIRDYSQRIFCESFLAGDILLMHKGEGSVAWKVINVFGLLPQESSLFN